MPTVIVDQRAATGTANAPWRLPSRVEEATEAEVWVVSAGIFSQSLNSITFQPSGTADAKSIPTTAQATEQQFRSLAEQWRRETGMLSSILKKAMHPAYQRIIGMGAGAIVPILRELQLRPDHWFWALTYITGENPVPQEAAGNLRRMAQAWTEWGRQRGYIS